jgi:Ulp1 family protease
MTCPNQKSTLYCRFFVLQNIKMILKNNSFDFFYTIDDIEKMKSKYQKRIFSQSILLQFGNFFKNYLFLF